MFNWTPNSFDSYKIGVPEQGTYKVVFDTAISKFGGDKARLAGTYKTSPKPIHGFEQQIDIKLHGLSAVYLKKVENKKK